MKFVVNSEPLLKQLTTLSGVISQSTSTSSVIDSFKFETDSTELSQTILDTESKRISLLEMLSIEPYDGPVPTRLVGFNEARCEKEHYGTVHFYLNDNLFECVWNNTPKFVPLLRQYESVIGPDFLKIWNNRCNGQCIKTAKIVYGLFFYLYLCTNNCCFRMQYKNTNNNENNRQIV